MTAHTITDFFREKHAHSPDNAANQEKKRHEWIGEVELLYKLIVENFLAASIASGSVSVSYRPKTIHEELLGTYEVRELVLRVGEETVVFSPKGRNIVGTSGRIDLQGEMGEATLLLQAEKGWSLVIQRVPTVRLVPLQESSLLAALKDVMRP